ncbi:hypothetical protein FGO68_gene6097 [Halteria grandinella]|uniref:Uncharacterized protein n=1 Tax=Halteria grandinella TaxID=5974 RepID=A0A8J8NUC2_HALGN|nr:hypothetical protein FGO68_gene6097 [Halteria grandinella]
MTNCSLFRKLTYDDDGDPRFSTQRSDVSIKEILWYKNFCEVPELVIECQLKRLLDILWHIRPKKKGVLTIICKELEHASELIRIYQIVSKYHFQLFRFEIYWDGINLELLEEFSSLKFAKTQHVICPELKLPPSAMQEERMIAWMTLMNLWAKRNEMTITIDFADFISSANLVLGMQPKQINIYLSFGWLPDFDNFTELDEDFSFEGTIKIESHFVSKLDHKFIGDIAIALLKKFRNLKGLIISESQMETATLEFSYKQLEHIKTKLDNLTLEINSDQNKEFYKNLMKFSKNSLSSLTINRTSAYYARKSQIIPVLDSLKDSPDLQSLSIQGEFLFLNNLDYLTIGTFKNLRHLTIKCFDQDDQSIQELLEKEFCNGLRNLQVLYIKKALIDPVKALSGVHLSLMKLTLKNRQSEVRCKFKGFSVDALYAIAEGKRKGCKIIAPIADGCIRLHPKVVFQGLDIMSRRQRERWSKKYKWHQ